jgi:hypothetical protein
LNVYPVANPGGNGFLTIATNDPPVDLYDYLTGNPNRGGVWAGPSAPYASDSGRYNPNFMYGGVYTYTVTRPRGCNSQNITSTVTVNLTQFIPSIVTVRAKVFLEGPLKDTTNFLMIDSLRAREFLQTSETYTPLGYVHVNGGGFESFDYEQLDSIGVDALVDWVYVELRSATDSTKVIATRSALLQRDGDIVDLDGLSPLRFKRVVPGAYYVVVGHRNHLSVMTAIPVSLDYAGTTQLDFTSGALGVFGSNPYKVTAKSVVSGGVRVLFGGDADFNGQIQNTDDVNFWQQQVGGSGYRSPDYDLNGQVQNLDRVFFWFPNIGKGTQVPPRSN